MKKCDCPIDTVASILGRRWVIIILRDLFMGKTQFKEFSSVSFGLGHGLDRLKRRDDRLSSFF